MKRTIIMLAALSLLPFWGRAQGTESDLESDFRGRFSLEGEHKIAKGLRVGVEAEARFADDFTSLRRLQAGAGITYKINSRLKAGGGYLFIENKNSSGEFKTRHRVYADLVFSHKSGDWKLSLKERVQITHKDVGNVYQNTPNLLASKTRLKAVYSGFGGIRPYAFAELRLVLNDPALTYSSSQQYDDDGFYYWPLSSVTYSDTYINRYRGGIGAEWKIDRKNSIDVFFMADYCYDKEIDTNKLGTKLKSLTYERTLAPTLGLAYKFSF